MVGFHHVVVAPRGRVQRRMVVDQLQALVLPRLRAVIAPVELHVDAVVSILVAGQIMATEWVAADQVISAVGLAPILLVGVALLLPQISSVLQV